MLNAIMSLILILSLVNGDLTESLSISKGYSKNSFSHSASHVQVENIEELLETKLNEKILEARNYAQQKAEDYAFGELEIWVNEFEDRLDSSGFLDWYFSYPFRKSVEDRQLLCSAGHFFRFFPQRRLRCDFFIQEVQDRLIETVLIPIENEVDDINVKALGIFFNSLKEKLHQDFQDLRKSPDYKPISRADWNHIESVMSLSVPGYEGEPIKAPPPVFLRLLIGSENRGELVIASELGEIAFQVPRFFRGEGKLKIPPKNILSKAAPEVSEMEKLGFKSVDLAVFSEEGVMLGLDLVRMQALIDPLFWVPIVLIESYSAFDLSRIKEQDSLVLRKELSNILREQISDLVKNENTGLRAYLERINIPTIRIELENSND